MYIYFFSSQEFLLSLVIALFDATNADFQSWQKCTCVLKHTKETWLLHAMEMVGVCMGKGDLFLAEDLLLGILHTLFLFQVLLPHMFAGYPLHIV